MSGELSDESRSFDVLVIGGGAAGLMCAIEAGRRGRRVLVVEHNERVGRKIEISGGGRCNFTNLHTTPADFISSNPHFAKSALSRYTPSDFIALVERHRIPYHEKKLGQLFCDRSSREIVEMLLDECERARVRVATNCRVSRVSKDESFAVETSRGRFESASLVVATGGLSIPKLGASDFGYRVARQFGLRVVTPSPALVPLTLAREDLDAFRELSGVSVDALVRAGGAEFAENFLITHRGLSGPAVLQISSYWERGASLSFDLLPGEDAQAFLDARREGGAELASVLATRLPRRFARAWSEMYARGGPVKSFSDAELRQVAARLRDWRVSPAGTEGFAKAEVTKGGVATDELSSKTMEARRVAGLYFIGEAVDVTGHLGGFNFQWAWASGFAAGQYV
ncbi:MAG TPA: NAD(P)/FAD-dependent oxidoreductase [Pyrinomonadaceae bacterium]|nr:NAD(P)/FAD-dependent oxidoreductase [Pyrinomonadaceae bacterium]